MKKQFSELLNRTLAVKKKLLFVLLALCALAIGVCSCKAWRTISTTATYVSQNDSAKTTQTITTKTVEEYQGVKKR
ncbi:MAG: hypothetical protein IJV28_03480 [Paludibacteraceae bacterium]|nr:hypothetical protein [Paludibacteraceae bacterium]